MVQSLNSTIVKMMVTTKPISPQAHGLIDYALVAALGSLPVALDLPKEVKKLYVLEALVLLGYVAISDHPAAVKRIIPFRVHGKIAPFNVAAFAPQTFSKAFRQNSRARIFNIIFIALSGLTVLLTDWEGNGAKALKA